MTTAADNAIRMVRDMVSGENAHDVERVFADWADDMQSYWNGHLLSTSKEQDMAGFPGMHAAFPDYQREIQWIGATDDRVVFQWVTRGTHSAEWLGFPATGKRNEWHGCSVCEHNGELLLVGRVYVDQGEMNRQLGGKVREPGTPSAAAAGPDIPESERAANEEAGDRLIRTIYEAENERDVEKQLACYADPLLDHFAGSANAMPLSVGREALPSWWESLPELHREIEEVIAVRNRAVLRWHLTADPIDGKRVSQHGCSVVEHDGQRITKFWAYYPDLARVFPRVLELG